MKTRIIISFCAVCFGLLGVSLGQGGYDDDLYAAPRRTVYSRGERLEHKAQQQQRRLENYYSDDFDNGMVYNELVTSYQEAMARRVDAYNNDEPRPQSYHQLMDEYRGLLLAKYDSSLYNIIEFNNMIWVEPQDITSLFDGTDPAQGVKEFAENHKKMITSDGGDGANRSKVQLNLITTVDPWYRPYGGGGYWGGYPYGGLNVGFGWGLGFSPYYDSYWSFGALWGPSWGYPGWGGYYGWGYPSWGYPHCGYYPGWGHHYPGHIVDGSGGGSSRPVIRGDGYGGGGAGGVSPSLRPGASSGMAQRPVYRTGSGGTNVVNYNTQRPASSRPSVSGSGASARPSVGVQVTRPTREQWQNSRPSQQPYRPASPSVSRPSPSPSPSRPSMQPSSGSRGGGRR